MPAMSIPLRISFKIDSPLVFAVYIQPESNFKDGSSTMLRMGLVGLGNIGRLHAEYLRAGEVENCELTAVAEANEELLKDFNDLECFADASHMIESGSVDAVLVATPSFSHYELGVQVLENGLHLLMEKPIATQKADGARMLAACGEDQVFGLMMNLRADPLFRRMKTMLGEGLLGELRRVNWTMTDWFRPEVYFASSSWRATWFGEGGGVLMNQCPHNLDIMQWLCGMPLKLRASCYFGKHHDIEVEDEVVASFEYANGAIGSFLASTGEAPGVNRLEIAGDKGLMVLENGVLTVTSYTQSVAEYSRTTDEMFGTPSANFERYRREDEEDINPHAAITRNFVDAIKNGVELISPASDGIASLELAGAMLYSEWTDSIVELPLDAEAYEAELKKRLAHSRPREVTRTAAKVDMSKSFSK